MADHTAIEWCDATVNPIRSRDRDTGKVGWHCEHRTPGCEFCYAETLNRRLGTGQPFVRQARDRVELFLDERLLTQPLRWRQSRVIFWNSMTDALGPFIDADWLDSELAVCALTPAHTHMFLTKREFGLVDYLTSPRDRSARIARAALRLADHVPPRHRGWTEGHFVRGGLDLPYRCAWPLPNVIFGVSVEDQRRADERREPLREVASAGWRTFVSYEPAIGPVNWQGWEFLKLLISGGETGRTDRIHHPDWHRQARDFAARHGIAYFFKHWGDWAPAPPITIPQFGGYHGCHVRPRTYDEAEAFAAGRPFEHWSDGTTMVRIGAHKAGRLLDGRTHDEAAR